MTSLAEIFSIVIGSAFGDVGIALIIFIASVSVLMWKSNIPVGGMLMIGLPLMGALVMVVTDDFVVTLFAMALIVVALMLWIAIGELTKKY